ncbi:membrane integrity-associated transporter subunit PqiC [Undibacterium sp. LX40W]|uniref:Membrane integrity-associated transporter subunit PqiC n=1 Tax=Undibacterium nitidum TaxID=2762298 RepID=A0A923HT05_9BURK|nr:MULTISPECIES: ABC-type transport auxiliary lipoprotein family protein [Undibacterium]MBC3882770.1 membrane integrity-associated transporter subunit PqiC [Undibacterium nitidum]MBC3893047.1 membrane integrity-associated transporter subunit PqiC [Undibacterium sp. LX40W]
MTNRPFHSNKRARISLIHSSLVALLLLLAACATSNTTQSFDFGPGVATSKSSTLELKNVKWVITNIQVPDSLDGNAMLYRLNYENPLALKPYAHSRWSASPAQLLNLRLKQAINQAGGAGLSASDGIKDVPLLRIELDEFAQHFSTPQRSQAHIQLRVGLVYKNNLLAQKSFSSEVDANTADAKGGAIAMSHASDQIIQKILQWAQQEQQSAKIP